MGIRLSTTELNETLIFQNKQERPAGESAFIERSYSLNHPAMEAGFTECAFDGFSIRHGKVKLKEDIEIVDENPVRGVVMYFNLSGESTTFLHDDGLLIRFSGRQHNLIYTPAFRANFKAGAGDETNDKLEIHIPEAQYKRITGNDSTMPAHFNKQIDSQKTAQLYKHSIATDAAINHTVAQILRPQKKGVLKKIYLESKILELLALQLEQFQSLDGGIAGKIKKADIERLHQAKTILEENITSPCSLIDLAHKVGINDFKLKSGFKVLFGKTVFGYLHELRMQKASELLQERMLTINEIAEYCGYEYVQHFISAFKKNYGVTPGSFSSQRNREGRL